MPKVLTIQPHPSDTATIEQTPDELLTWLQGRVGGYIELVCGDGWSVVVNEEGRMQGLPINVVASEMMHRLGRDVGPLLGAAVFVGADDDDDVPDEVIEVAAEFVVFDWQATGE